MNHGENEAVTNLDEHCIAQRDIQMGEELLEDYSDFVGFEGDNWFRDIRGVAWKDDVADDRALSADEYNLLGAPKVWGIGSSNNRGIDPFWLVVAFWWGSCFSSLSRDSIPPVCSRNEKPGRGK